MLKTNNDIRTFHWGTPADRARSISASDDSSEPLVSASKRMRERKRTEQDTKGDQENFRTMPDTGTSSNDNVPVLAASIALSVDDEKCVNSHIKQGSDSLAEGSLRMAAVGRGCSTSCTSLWEFVDRVAEMGSVTIMQATIVRKHPGMQAEISISMRLHRSNQTEFDMMLQEIRMAFSKVDGAVGQATCKLVLEPLMAWS